MRGLSFHPLAELELQEASYFYESVSTGLGTTFVNSIDACTRSILEFPRSGRTIRGKIRQRLARGFPYASVYRESGDRIRVLAVMHTKRRPSYWARRR